MSASKFASRVESSFDYCPVCGDFTDLDEHHWQYEPVEITVDICRSCHEYVHGDRRVREQGDD